jgi:hypothetical protein
MAEQERKPPGLGGGSKKKWTKNKRNGGRYTVPVRPGKFQGKEEMGGHHFDCQGDGQGHQCTKTIEMMADLCCGDYTNGGTTRKEIMDQRKIVIAMPARPTGNPPDALDIIDYTQAKKTAEAKIMYQKENWQKVFSLGWGQCTEAMKAKIKSHAEFPAIELALDGIDLLRVIKLICYDIGEDKYAPLKAHEMKVAYHTMKQGNDSNEVYHSKFSNVVLVAEQSGCLMGVDRETYVMVAKELRYNEDTTDATEIVEITKMAKDIAEATAFLVGSDQRRYGTMLRDLKNSTMKGVNHWPKTLTQAHGYLCKYDNGEDHAKRSYEHTGTSFMTENSDGSKPWHKGFICRNCNKKDHIARDCPEKKKKAVANVQDGEADGEADEDGTQQLMNAIEEDEEEYNGYADLFVCEGFDSDDDDSEGPPPLMRRNENYDDSEHDDSENEEDSEELFVGGDKWWDTVSEETGILLSDEWWDTVSEEADILLSDGERHETTFQSIGQNGGAINKNWMLIDTGSTVNVVSNKEMLEDVHEEKGSLTIHTQTGKGKTNMRGELPGYGQVWYHEGGIANILSLAKVKETRHVAFDSANGNEFVVTNDNGSQRVFKQSPRGLYYYDMTKHMVKPKRDVTTADIPGAFMQVDSS